MKYKYKFMLYNVLTIRFIWSILKYVFKNWTKQNCILIYLIWMKWPNFLKNSVVKCGRLYSVFWWVAHGSIHMKVSLGISVGYPHWELKDSFSKLLICSMVWWVVLIKEQGRALAFRLLGKSWSGGYVEFGKIQVRVWFKKFWTGQLASKLMTMHRRIGPFWKGTWEGTELL